MKPRFFLTLAALLIGASVGLSQTVEAQGTDERPPKATVPAGANDLMRYPQTRLGQDVHVTFITRCFTWDGAYFCTPTAPSLQGRIIIRAAHFMDDEAREHLQQSCGNMATACRYDIVFNVKAYGTDMTGQIRTIDTDVIWGRRPY
jgi:hypothetical protein